MVSVILSFVVIGLVFGAAASAPVAAGVILAAKIFSGYLFVRYKKAAGTLWAIPKLGVGRGLLTGALGLLSFALSVFVSISIRYAFFK